jgi:hypothetical protein
MTSACPCEFVTPSHIACEVMDRGMRSYEWFRDEGNRQARRSTAMVAGLAVVLYAVAYLIFA